MSTHSFPAGIDAALLAAALFGASTPLAKALLGGVEPVLLAGLLYARIRHRTRLVPARAQDLRAHAVRGAAALA